MLSQEKIIKIRSQYAEICAEMSAEIPKERFIELSREFANLDTLVKKIDQLEETQIQLQETELLMKDADDALVQMAKEEKNVLHKIVTSLEHEVRLMLLPKDSTDFLNSIVEIRAGTGGDEAALFCGDLFRMYERYATFRKWNLEIVNATASELGGFKEIVLSITGDGVFAHLKFESGVHRVQRVPTTESNGRLHTSAATVAVLPEPKEVDICINEADLRIDVYRASGAGGQHVNKTESAVRITHLPTGVVVAQQSERSQHKNKARALQILSAKLFDAQRFKQDQERASQRKEQVGSGDRSQRIRTYNFPQGRVTDHRINLTLHNLSEILEGQGLDQLIQALVLHAQTQKLLNL